MTRPVEKTALQAVSFIGFALCLLVALWGWQTGVLTSQERLQALVAGCGVAGVLLFTAFQAVQVVVPILPGGLGCLAGVLLFGPVWGFVYNYVGICAGSLLAFAVALALTVLWGSAAVPLPKRPPLPEVPQRLQSWPQRWSDSLDGALSRFNDMFDDLGGTVLRSAQGGNP